MSCCDGDAEECFIADQVLEASVLDMLLIYILIRPNPQSVDAKLALYVIRLHHAPYVWYLVLLTLSTLFRLWSISATHMPKHTSVVSKHTQHTARSIKHKLDKKRFTMPYCQSTRNGC